MDNAYRGVDMPFSSSEISAVQAQALRAAISAKLPLIFCHLLRLLVGDF
jgi:hypothetical protein